MSLSNTHLNQVELFQWQWRPSLMLIRQVTNKWQLTWQTRAAKHFWTCCDVRAVDCRLLWHLDFDVTHLTALTDDIWQVDGFLTTWLTKVWIDYSLKCRSLRCQWLSCHINVICCLLSNLPFVLLTGHWVIDVLQFSQKHMTSDNERTWTVLTLTSCQFQVLTWHMTHADLGLHIPDQASLTSWKQINLTIVNADWFEHIACIDHMFFASWLCGW